MSARHDNFQIRQSPDLSLDEELEVAGRRLFPHTRLQNENADNEPYRREEDLVIDRMNESTSEDNIIEEYSS
jgi:hypothetical protein